MLSDFSKIGRLISALTLLVCAPAAMHSKVETVHIQWREDIVLNANFEGYSEGFNDNKPIARTREPGTIQVYVRNTGKTPVKLNSLSWTGKPVAELRQANDLVWSRLVPATIPPGGYAALMLRVRMTPTAPAPLAAEFDDGSRLSLSIDPVAQNAPVRFESVGFAPDGRWASVVLRNNQDGDSIKTLRVNGSAVKDADRRWIIRKTFRERIAALIPAPAPVGSFVYFEAETSYGHKTACLLRKNDGFVPLGTYDHPNGLDARSLAEADMNTVVGHHRYRKDQLDDMHALGLRCIQYTENEAPDASLHHPAITTLINLDEPDAKDYFYWVKRPDAPAYVDRVGYHAQACSDGVDLIHDASPKFEAAALIDLTFKPWNWYDYGQTADVIYSDNYPLTHGDPLDLISAVQQQVMSAAAPLPVVHVFDNCWQEKTGRGINRPKTAAEQRRIMLYAFGEGAKGLLGWWNVSAKEGDITYHGIDKFPDQWIAQSEVFSTLHVLDPLTPIAFPLQLASSPADKIWVRTLVAGRDALIVTVINEDYDYSATHSWQRTRHNVPINLAALPGFKVHAIHRVSPNRLDPVPFATDQDNTTRLTLPKLVTGEVLLVTADSSLPKTLLAADTARNVARLATIARFDRNSQRATGQAAALLWDLRLNRTANLVAGQPGTGIATAKHGDFPNVDSGDNAYRWDREPTGERHTVSWEITQATDGPATLVVQATGAGAQTLQSKLLEANGNEQNVPCTISREKNLLICEFPRLPAGRYKIRIGQSSGASGKVEIAKSAYVLPGYDIEALRDNAPPTTRTR